MSDGTVTVIQKDSLLSPVRAPPLNAQPQLNASGSYLAHNKKAWHSEGCQARKNRNGPPGSENKLQAELHGPGISC
jgi:hypothetical protein